jgi:hypothetical protein
MFRLHLEHYIVLGQNIEKCREFMSGASAQHNGNPVPPMAAVAAVLGQLRSSCEAIELTASVATIDKAIKGNRITNFNNVELLIDSITSEMETRLFLRVPGDRAKYWQRNDLVSNDVAKVFPIAASEIREAGTAYACGLWPSSVFHSMRAAEKALVAIANELGIHLSGSEMWGNYCELIEAHVAALAKKPKADPEKATKLAPLSEITADLRLFKDAWRNQNTHQVVPYSDGKALEILTAVCRVLEAAAIRVKL